MHTITDARWDDLNRSAATVRAAGVEARPVGAAWGRRLALRAAYLVAAAGLTAVGVHALATAPEVHADGSADSVLFSLTNQDRASNGVGALTFNGTLSNIGEGGSYGGCGFLVSGRAVDMIQRNYFAHPILNCGGQLVFSIMHAYGVNYRSAGENIAWNAGGSATDAAAQANTAFMNSPGHRANILNPNYTELGTGSATSGSSPWTGGGGSYTGAWMFSEEFAQLGSAPAPPPPPHTPPPPAPRPTAGSGSGSGGGSSVTPTRNSPAPAAPGAPAASTAAPVPSAAPSAAPAEPTVPPTPVPTATPIPSLTVPPGFADPGGLLYDSIESVLESYLIS